MPRIMEYDLSKQMRRLADALFDLANLHLADGDREKALRCYREARGLAAIGAKVVTGTAVNKNVHDALSAVEKRVRAQLPASITDRRPPQQITVDVTEPVKQSSTNGGG